MRGSKRFCQALLLVCFLVPALGQTTWPVGTLAAPIPIDVHLAQGSPTQVALLHEVLWAFDLVLYNRGLGFRLVGSDDPEVEVVFSPEPPKWVPATTTDFGYTEIRYKPRSGRIVSGRVWINASHPLAAQRETLYHEFLHVLGWLEHAPESSGSARRVSMGRNSLASYDLALFDLKYPVRGGY